MAETTDRRFVYRIDANDRIDFVSPEWLAFATENNAPNLTEPAVLGTSIWQWIADADTRELYRTFIERVRASMPAITIPFRCDSPTTKRFMEMRLKALSGGSVELCGSIRSLVERDAVRLLDRESRRSSDLIEACSFCKRLNVEGEGWLEADVAVTKLCLFDAAAMPQLSHGVCGDCSLELHRRLQI